MGCQVIYEGNIEGTLSCMQYKIQEKYSKYLKDRAVNYLKRGYLNKKLYSRLVDLTTSPPNAPYFYFYCHHLYCRGSNPAVPHFYEVLTLLSTSSPYLT